MWFLPLLRVIFGFSTFFCETRSDAVFPFAESHFQISTFFKNEKKSLQLLISAKRGQSFQFSHLPTLKTPQNHLPLVQPTTLKNNIFK
jgi:hypothetical protein